MFRAMAKRKMTKMAATQGIRQVAAEVFERIKQEMGY